MTAKGYKLWVDHEERLICCRQVGDASLIDLARVRIELHTIAQEYDNCYSILNDCRELNPIFRLDDFDRIWRFFEQHHKGYRDRLEAILASKPLTCAYSLLIQDECQRRFGYEIRLFSTEAAARWWLKMRMQADTIDRVGGLAKASEGRLDQS